MKNKKGMSTGAIFLIIGLLIVGYVTNFAGMKDFLTPEEVEEEVGVGQCPSSGLTEVTINAQEALASTATNANVSYYFFDGNALVSNGDTGTDGTVAVDVGCGRTYTLLVINEKTQTGFYPQTVSIVADRATITKNFKMYEYGQINVASVVSSTDPTGAANISAGTGKLCGFTVTFANNESASAINKPLIMLMSNSTAVTDITLTGATEATAKAPTRLTVPAGRKFWIFEYDELVKSTDGAIKLSGKIQFSASANIPSGDVNNMSCRIVDQATYRIAEWQTLGLSEGFVEAAENIESITDIGAPDSAIATVAFAGTYC